MAIPGKKLQSIHALTSLVVLVAFLLLGFCPLRNALRSFGHAIPKKEIQPTPEYAKIIDCTIAAVNEMPSFHERAISGSTLIFAAIILATFFLDNGFLTSRTFCYQKIAAPRPNKIPIYLKNQTMLI